MLTSVFRGHWQLWGCPWDTAWDGHNFSFFIQLGICGRSSSTSKTQILLKALELQIWVIVRCRIEPDYKTWDVITGGIHQVVCRPAVLYLCWHDRDLCLASCVPLTWLSPSISLGDPGETVLPLGHNVLLLYEQHKDSYATVPFTKHCYWPSPKQHKVIYIYCSNPYIRDCKYFENDIYIPLKSFFYLRL